MASTCLCKSPVGFNPRNRAGVLCSLLSISLYLAIRFKNTWAKERQRIGLGTKDSSGSWETLGNSIPDVEMNNLPLALSRPAAPSGSPFFFFSLEFYETSRSECSQRRKIICIFATLASFVREVLREILLYRTIRRQH